MKIDCDNAELRRIPKETKKLDIEASKKVMALVEIFEEDDDVQNVFHNLEITDELMNSME
jgi:transcriptional/translational regulatory protein YebC/TACO1